MEASENCSVKVAVHIRPLIGSERVQGCKECVIVTPGVPQVQIGSHSFTFDHVYGNDGSPSSAMFEECVAPLVDGLFQGYNGTVLAYGQTGSGKTHTMGTNYKEGFQTGLIPQVMNTFFSKIQSLKQQSEFQLHVSFIEILNEEVRDLLDSVSVTKSMTANGHSGKVSVSGRPPVQIRELSNGVITLAGSSEVAVCTLDEMVACLERGSVCRATGSTNMNHQSSRSHAIFTITLVQMRKLHSVSPVNDTPDEDMGEEYICAKLHLVDLAGSERAKRTGSDGLRLKEGIHINRGLLALGNVISALGDEKKRKGVHVPYRDSKLTRLLQDSLGGNSKTVMIACINPADINAEETLNTLKYANRARNIQNKPVVNRDLISSELQQMRQQLKHLQDELSARGAPSDEIKVLKQKIALLEASNEDLSRELHEYRSRCSIVEQRKIDSEGGYANCTRSDGLKRDFQNMYSSDYQNNEGVTGENSVEIDEIAKEWEHTLMRSTMDKELHELNRCLQRKESELKLFGEVDTEALEKHFRKKITELEEDKRVIQNHTANFDDQTLKTQDNNSQKLKELEAQISVLKREQESQVDLLKQKQGSEAMAKQLLAEIRHIKAQKVQLQQKMKQETEQFRQWKASRGKEVQHLRKEGRRNDYKRHKLEALHQRQKLDLQRKTEEAAMATRRLKELLEACKSSPCESSVYSSEHASSQGNDKSLRMLLDHELEVMVNVHEVRFQYEKQKQEHCRLEEELTLLKQADQLDPNNSAQKERNDELGFLLMSPCARMARISSLENMLSVSSNALMAMASQLSEAEEKEHSLISPGRWNQLGSMGEAKNLLQYMFTTTVEARCQLWDKDMEIKDLTDQMKELISLLQQSEAQMKELVEEQKIREQAIAIDLAQSVLGSSCGSSTHNLDDLSGPLSARSLPTPKQLKFSPGVAKSAAFLDHAQRIVPLELLPMNKRVATGQSGKLWKLLQFKWKWQKPWKLSDWMKHSDETIMKSRPCAQLLVDMI